MIRRLLNYIMNILVLICMAGPLERPLLERSSTKVAPSCPLAVRCANDTHQGFGADLLDSLKVRGFSVKLVSGDHRNLKKEEIECFRIFIIVFFHQYATSSSRLDKLTEIFNKYGATEDRLISPIFFDVEPNHVRYQKGSFDIAFDSHANHVVPKCLQRWRKTLKEVADITGWPFKRYPV